MFPPYLNSGTCIGKWLWLQSMLLGRKTCWCRHTARFFIKKLGETDTRQCVWFEALGAEQWQKSALLNDDHQFTIKLRALKFDNFKGEWSLWFNPKLSHPDLVDAMKKWFTSIGMRGHAGPGRYWWSSV